jgi:hypothetical protein
MVHKITASILLILTLCVSNVFAGGYVVVKKSATTVTSTSDGGNIGLFTRVSSSNNMKFDAYSLRIRQAQYRTLDFLISEVGSGPGANYDTCYAGETWESPIQLSHNDGIYVNLTTPVSGLIIEATFYHSRD